MMMVCVLAKCEIKNKNIDWDKEKELAVLCDKYRSKNGDYDCLVPGSGGKIVDFNHIK